MSTPEPGRWSSSTCSAPGTSTSRGASTPSRTGRREFFLFDSPALNTASSEEADRAVRMGQGKVVDRHTVQTVTLPGLLDRYLRPGQPIDFLSIDVEGLDAAILQVPRLRAVSAPGAGFRAQRLGSARLGAGRAYRRVERPWICVDSSHRCFGNHERHVGPPADRSVPSATNTHLTCSRTHARSRLRRNPNQERRRDHPAHARFASFLRRGSHRGYVLDRRYQGGVRAYRTVKVPPAARLHLREIQAPHPAGKRGFNSPNRYRRDGQPAVAVVDPRSAC